MLTVLVADDEFAVLEVLSMALESEGHRVLKAGDGADALRVLVSQPCDVVVCDETMPVMNGVQLVEAMRADPRLADIPVVMIVDGFRQGPLPEGIAVLHKPILLSRLFSTVGEAGAIHASRKPSK
ncbi:MAG TPA: response regulator [Kofleriaceae bacterium]|nr:response regulator [Kofleriaceae bacterium]